jgi:hypothetical protein
MSYTLCGLPQNICETGVIVTQMAQDFVVFRSFAKAA